MAKTDGRITVEVTFTLDVKGKDISPEDRAKIQERLRNLSSDMEDIAIESLWESAAWDDGEVLRLALDWNGDDMEQDTITSG